MDDARGFTIGGGTFSLGEMDNVPWMSHQEPIVRIFGEQSEINWLIEGCSERSETAVVPNMAVMVNLSTGEWKRSKANV